MEGLINNLHTWLRDIYVNRLTLARATLLDLLSRLDATITSRASQTSVDTANTNINAVGTAVGTVNTGVSAANATLAGVATATALAAVATAVGNIPTSVINSIQYGTVSAGTPVTIATVNRATSILIPLGWTMDNPSSGAPGVRLDLNPAGTTITAHTYDGTGCSAGFCVVEFK